MRAKTAAICDWWARDRGAQTAGWIANYRRSVNGRQRTAIVQAVTGLAPSTLLEIGCHCGPNLVRLAREIPHLRMIGIDASREAIDAGRIWVASEGVANRIQLNCGRVPEALEALASGSFDVVMSSYCLAYQSPDDVDRVLYEMGRLAVRGVVVAEPMALTGTSPGCHETQTGYTEWTHDYLARKPWIGTLRTMCSSVTPFDPPVERLNGIICFDACSGGLDGNT